MNVLFIGPYRQNDGWGVGAQRYLECLATLDVNLSCVPIYMSRNIERNVTSKIKKLENNYFDNYDIVIQNVLPNFFVKTSSYNIGIYYSETNNLNNSTFINYINLLDELWVSTESEKTELSLSGVKIPILVIPIPFKKPEKGNPLDLPGVDDNYIFYMIAEYTERKNLEATIIAYNREFKLNEKVSLLIKTGFSGLDEQDNQKKVLEEISNIKKKMRLYNDMSCYNNEILITNRLSNEQINSVHNKCDCLIVPSRGEAYCLPAVEALYSDNKVICTSNIHTESMLKPHCTTVKSTEVPIFIDNPPAPHIYTGWETWHEISILDLQRKMRDSFKQRNTKNKTSDWVQSNFGYKSVSKKMKERICP